MSSPRIDSHQHFWRLSRGDYGWLTPQLAPLYRDFDPEHLAPLLRARGIGACIAVQAAESTDETRFLLSLAATHPWIVGVVGWVDAHAPGAADDADALRALGPLVGLRPMLQDRTPGHITDARATPMLEWLAREGLAFDALVRTDHLGDLRLLLERHPALRMVVDHAAKPNLRPGADAATHARWTAGMRTLAERGAWVKLSGLLTEAAAGAGAEALRPTFDFLLETFGAHRVLWGSDWPVLTLAARYEHWCAVTDALLSPLTPDERDGILGGNAARFYRLGPAAGTP